MDRLWLRMVEIYGHKWTSSYGDEPNESWSRCMFGLTAEQLKTGLNALLRSTETWPPTAVQFRQMCTGRDGLEWERQCHRVIDTSHLIEDKTSEERRKAERKSRWAKLREECGI